MARRGNSGGGGGRSASVLLAVGIVLIAAACVYYRQRQGSTTGVLEQTAEVISDGRMIYGGAPRAGTGAGHEADFEALKNLAYISGYSETREDPLWVAYRVFHNVHPNDLPRPADKFVTDTRTTARVKDADFSRSGYDRGHMAPNSAIARDYGAEAQIETFLLSNICPQAPTLNRDVWEKLEAKEKTYGDAFDEVWVIDGPIFGDLNGGATEKLASGIAVPEAFYKILIDEENGKPRLMAVIMPQDVKKDDLPQEYLTSVKEIEKRTHLEFLWKLDGGTREVLEGKVWPMWALN